MKFAKTTKTVAIAGLLITAPFATFAVGGENMLPYNSDVNMDEIEQKKLDRLNSAFEKHVEKAELLIAAVEDKGEDTSDLEELVEDFLDLQATIISLDVTEIEAEEFEEMFFEYKEDAKEITSEFRSELEGIFSDEEKQELREQLRDLHEKDRSKAFKFAKSVVSDEVVEILSQIDSDAAQDLEEQEITLREAHSIIKEHVDSLSQEEREEFFEEHGFPHREKPEGERQRGSN